jgi:hypothetical protein
MIPPIESMSVPHIDTISRLALVRKSHNEQQSTIQIGEPAAASPAIPVEGCGTVGLVISDSS